MKQFNDFLKEKLREIEEAGLYRERIVLPPDTVDFSSNDYLGLRDNPSTKEKLCRSIESIALGSGASALISGFHPIQKELEESLAEFKNTESCLVVGSGYMANIGLIPAISEEGDTIFSDQLNHASIIDGIRISKASKLVYRHCDVEDLERKIRTTNTKGKRIIVTDSVFSMDGDIAPLDELVKISQKYDAVLVIDEAHSTGVLGEEGRGIFSHFGIEPTDNTILMGTLSKAVGSYGAFICGTKLLINYLINRMRSVIFTTALSPLQNFVSLYNLKAIKEEVYRRERLFRNVETFLEISKREGLDVNFFGTPIITYIVSEPKRTLYIRDKLLENGIFVGAVRPPTVPPGTSRLRITITSKHTPEDLKRLLSTLSKIVNG